MIILIIDGCFGSYDPMEPFYFFTGIVLTILMIILIILQKKRDKKLVKKEETIEPMEPIFQETDVFGLDKPSVNPNEPSYRPANKSKLKYVVYILLMIVGLLLIILNTSKKWGPPEYSPSSQDTIEQAE